MIEHMIRKEDREQNHCESVGVSWIDQRGMENLSAQIR